VVRWCIHGVPSSYLSRTCLVPPMWIVVHMGGTRQVRDRYAVDTPSKLAGSMGEVSACGPSRAHASGQQVCWKPLGFKALALPQPYGTARPLLVHCLRYRRQPDSRFRKSANVLQPSLRAQADLLTELPLRFFKSPSKSEVFGDLLATRSKQQMRVFLRNSRVLHIRRGS
jgi:hypothetical protein